MAVFQATLLLGSEIWVVFPQWGEDPGRFPPMGGAKGRGGTPLETKRWDFEPAADGGCDDISRS